MGVFWNGAVLKKQDMVDIQEVIKELAEGDNPFRILSEECFFYDCEGGTAVVFNDGSIGFEALAEALSLRIEGPVLVCSIYDGDYWDYYLYKAGKELNRFMTLPDYFEEVDDKEKERWRGNAELLSEEFGCPAAPLAPYLHFWEESGEEDPWEVLDFLSALGFAIEEDDVPDTGISNDLQEKSDLSKREESDTTCEKNVCSGAIPKAEESWILPSLEPAEEWNWTGGGNKINLPEALEVDPKLIEWVRIRGEGHEEEIISGSMLTSKQIVHWIDETLNGRYVYLAIDFLFQGEGIYVKRLKKKVYRPFHSTLVIHQSAGKMACLFFAGDSMYCYKLIGDYHAYCEVDSKELLWIPVGDVVLSEYVVFRERSGIDRALYWLFSDLEHADRRLKASGFWSATNVFPGGANNYKRMRRELGLLED